MVLTAQSRAQSGYKYKADLKGIKTNGFYQIILPPQIVAKCINGLDDMRILDNKGQVVPYIVQKDVPSTNYRRFIEFPALPPDKDSTAIKVKSTCLFSIQRLYLTIKNNTVQRSINLSGSDDGKRWYAISENISLNGPDNSGADHYEQALAFPPSTYPYYKVTVSDKNKTPIKILKVGVYTNDASAGMYQLLPAPIISQKDSNSHSYIQLKFDAPYNIDKLTLGFTGPKYFKRSVSFPNFDPVTFSKSPSDFFNLGRTGNLQITIENQDNPPLKVISASAYQLSQSLMTYLETGKSYHLAFGDSTAKQPDYDLRFFTDSLNKNLKIAGLGEITANTDHKPTSPQKSDFNFTYLMWGAIIIIILALAFFTYKMANEVKAKNS